jgi:hypothetical protein
VAGHEPWGHHRTSGPVPSELRSISALKKRIAAEYKFMMDILAELLAHLQSDAEMRGTPGAAGPRGEQGPPGKLPSIKSWRPDAVHYEGDVVAYDGGTFQARRDTGQPPSHSDWICLAAAGCDGESIAVRGTFRRLRKLSSSRLPSLSTEAASSRSRTRQVPAPVPAGSCYREFAC